jgi:hypothetical protein
VLSSWITNFPAGVAQTLTAVVVVVVVGPAYMGGSPLSVVLVVFEVLEASQEADSVIVESAVTVISDT